MHVFPRINKTPNHSYLPPILFELCEIDQKIRNVRNYNFLRRRYLSTNFNE